jgi:hypothetical protein
MIIKNYNIIFLLFLSLFSLWVNNIYGNIGILPIDSFAFFDTAHSILLGKHPFKDFWITTGPLVDYLQALFFEIFGIKWFSYVIHASFFNLIITISSFIFFIRNKLNIFLSFFYSLSISILCYPIMGTPFAYHHAFILSIISLFIFVIAVKYKSNLAWFFLPIIMVLSFLSMQTPSAYINLVILFYSLLFFLNIKNIILLKYFFLGSFVILLSLILYFILNEIPITNFIQQYILFPISIGSNRIISSEEAFVTLQDKLTLRGVVGHFKFLHLIILVLISTLILKIKKDKKIFKDGNLICILAIITSSYFFIFNQLVTANQTFIFSLIPIIAGFSHIYISYFEGKKILISIFIISIVAFSTVKYHYVYNEKRKFIDLQNYNLEKAVDARLIDNKFSGLKWITPAYYDDPLKEIDLIKASINILKKDRRRKMVITNYQFLSSILEEDTNLINRWYTHDNNSYPLKNHKYYNFYKKFINDAIKSNRIEVVYIVDASPKGGIQFNHFKNYLTDNCFESKDIIEEVVSSHKLVNCK